MIFDKNDNSGSREGMLSKLVKTGYKNSEDILKEFSLNRFDKSMPKLKEVEQAVLHGVTDEQFEVVKAMERPVLLVVPICSGKRYLKALDNWVGTQDYFKENIGEIIEEEIELGITMLYTFPSDWGQGAIKRLEERNKIEGDKIIGWEWVIIEGVSDVPKPDDSEGVLRDRIGAFEEKKGLHGVGLYEYMMLMMESLKNGCPIDQETWTVMNGEPFYEDTVAGGYFDGFYAYLQMSIIGVPYPAARLRPMIFGAF